MRIRHIIRLDNWWSAKLPPLLAIAYIQILSASTPMATAAALLCCLLFSVCCVAAYGHVINDIFDIAADQRAGKRNSMAGMKPGWWIAICLGLLVLGFVPAALVSYSPWGLLLLLLNYVWPTIYSWPGLRLKERGLWGVMCDAAGSHVTPTLFVLTVFPCWTASTWFICVATAWSIVLGIKGILYHQIVDHENDVRSATSTFAVTQSRGRIERFLPRYNLLVEVPMNLTMVLCVQSICPLAGVGFALYCLLEGLKHRLKFQFTLGHASSLRRSIPFANNLHYEFWLPMAALAELCGRDPSWLWLPVMHALAFHNITRTQAQDLLAITAGLARKLRLDRRWKVLQPRTSALPTAPLMSRRYGNDRTRADAVRRGTRFLRQRQTPFGELPTLRSDTRLDLADAVPDSCIFSTCNALYSLEHVPDDTAQHIRDAGARFLVEQMEENGLWRYWSSHGNRRVQIPRDADDTACASFALRRHRPEIYRGNNVERLLRWRSEDGLFLTWLDDPVPFGWSNDVDAVVNANVLLYLGDCAETQRVSEYLCQLIEHDREAGSYHYYCNDLALYYAISRAYFHGCDSLTRVLPLVNAKVQRWCAVNRSLNDLDCALALSTLQNIGMGSSSVALHLGFALMKRQRRNGSWRKHAFFQGVQGAGCYGSEELVSVLCIEALGRLEFARNETWRSREMIGSPQHCDT